MFSGCLNIFWAVSRISWRFWKHYFFRNVEYTIVSIGIWCLQKIWIFSPEFEWRGLAYSLNFLYVHIKNSHKLRNGRYNFALLPWFSLHPLIQRQTTCLERIPAVTRGLPVFIFVVLAYYFWRTNQRIRLSNKCYNVPWWAVIARLKMN